MLRRGSLAWLVRVMDHVPVVPLMGFPGVSVNQNDHNWRPKLGEGRIACGM